jgi:bifunctional NMN adenylyltransferase/nudix hydrolase
MIDSFWDGDAVTVLPLPDMRSDKEWSKNVDRLIESVTQTDSITLYGGKDSFIPHYSGRFKTEELTGGPEENSTDLRETVAHSYYHFDEEEFRRGAIYACYRRFPIIALTVDIGVYRWAGNGSGAVEILVGRKPGETKWRLPGGFVDQDEEPMRAAKRELWEETQISGADQGEFKLIHSCQIDDWRYRNVSNSSLITLLYAAEYQHGTPVAGDDLEVVGWLRPDKDINNVISEHVPLLKRIVEYAKFWEEVSNT